MASRKCRLPLRAIAVLEEALQRYVGRWLECP